MRKTTASKNGCIIGSYQTAVVCAFARSTAVWLLCRCKEGEIWTLILKDYEKI